MKKPREIIAEWDGPVCCEDRFFHDSDDACEYVRCPSVSDAIGSTIVKCEDEIVGAVSAQSHEDERSRLNYSLCW